MLAEVGFAVAFVLRSLLLLTSSLLFAGCGVWRPTPVPMRTLTLPAACATRPETLIVFLPGSYSLPEDYVEHGFSDRLRQRQVAADILLVDAHLGYYSERDILDRLQLDVIAPARERGYRHIWLVGISVGAYGAMLYSSSAPARSAEIDGIVAIAPYLGNRRYATSVETSGGLKSWPGATQAAPGDVDETLWRWLQTLVARPETPLYLAYGRDDRFAYSDRVLAAALPADHVFSLPGGHDWPVWESLWERLVPILPLPIDRSCAKEAAR
ncbi:MAG: alpha/beta hydrolase [Pseudomonadota bacterium]|nr:alpha/beta hydrolase [Pseudomonadota bacterium]